jgi:hypothetical protein
LKFPNNVDEQLRVVTRLHFNRGSTDFDEQCFACLSDWQTNVNTIHAAEEASEVCSFLNLRILPSVDLMAAHHSVAFKPIALKSAILALQACLLSACMDIKNYQDTIEVSVGVDGTAIVKDN